MLTTSCFGKARLHRDLLGTFCVEHAKSSWRPPPFFLSFRRFSLHNPMSSRTSGQRIALETESDFTDSDPTRVVVSCQRPDIGSECKNPAGPHEPPNGILHPITNRRLQTQVLMCTPCYDYMMSKSTTVTRQRFPNSVATQTPMFAVNHQSIRAGTNAAQRGGEPIHVNPICFIHC